MAKNPKILSIVLAGGEGTRLMPLTRDRAKPAVPFGGVFRLIDFPLSNLVNSGYMQTVVLTQYKSHSLDRHISTVWRFSPLLGNYVSLFRLSSDLASTGISLCRRHLPDHQHHRGRAAGYCGDRRRDTSTAWISSRWCSSISNPARSSRWRVFASRSASPTSSA